MPGIQLDHVRKEKLEQALAQIRSDIQHLQVDLAGAEGNKVTWFFIILWLVLADVLQNFIHLNNIVALGIAGVIVIAYRVIDGYRITSRALRMAKVPLDHMFDTKVDLS